jgi:hypothetical protein
MASAQPTCSPSHLVILRLFWKQHVNHQLDQFDIAPDKCIDNDTDKGEGGWPYPGGSRIPNQYGAQDRQREPQ